jgi:hypothetical protein
MTMLTSLEKQLRDALIIASKPLSDIADYKCDHAVGCCWCDVRAADKAVTKALAAAQEKETGK